MRFFSELRRRNVCKVIVVYLSTSWLLLQIVNLVLKNINAPGWVMQAFMLTLIAGIPIMLVAAWILELTPEGLKLEKDVEPGKSIARQTGRQLTRGIVMILSMAIVLFLTEKFRDEAWFTPVTGGNEIEKTSASGQDDCADMDQSRTECDGVPS